MSHLTKGYWGHAPLTQAQGQSPVQLLQTKAQVITSQWKYRPASSFSILESHSLQDPAGYVNPGYQKAHTHSLAQQCSLSFNCHQNTGHRCVAPVISDPASSDLHLVACQSSVAHLHFRPVSLTRPSQFTLQFCLYNILLGKSSTNTGVTHMPRRYGNFNSTVNNQAAAYQQKCLKSQYSFSRNRSNI